METDAGKEANGKKKGKGTGTRPHRHTRVLGNEMERGKNESSSLESEAGPMTTEVVVLCP